MTEKNKMYLTPGIKVVELENESILCQSGNQTMDWQDLGNGGFREQ